MTAEQQPTPHLAEDRCFYCVTDAELSHAVERDGPHPTIHMDTPITACPNSQWPEQAS